jgi:hypothetical protein
VLVIGGGNSACDIAVEAARFSASAHISMRRGYWFMPKTMGGIPAVEFMRPWLPVPVQRTMLKTLLRAVVGRYERYGLPHPDHESFEKHPTINSELLHNIRHGRITPRPDIARFEGHVVVFVDGARELRSDRGRDRLPREPSDGRGAHRPLGRAGHAGPHRREHPARSQEHLFLRHRPAALGRRPLVSVGADLMATIVLTQRELSHPIGAILKRLGQKPLTTHLQDPMRLLRGVRRARRLVPLLPKMEGAVMRGQKRSSERSTRATSAPASGRRDRAPS